MSRYHVIALNVFCWLICTFAVTEVWAQGRAKADTVRADTIKNKYLPTGIRFGTDVISLIKSQTQDNYTGWEVNGEMDVGRYFLAVDYGTWGRNLNSDSAAYRNDGNFWRAGVDVNFLQKDPDQNVFFLGARYARGSFSENLSLISSDPIWGTVASEYQQLNIHARWLELTAGIRVKMWKIFWLGYTGRWSFRLKTDPTPEMLPYDVPGFGRTDKNTSWGFNYYFMIRVPIRKTPVAVVKK